MILTKDEKKLIEHAKEAVVENNKKRKSRGGIDTVYSFVMSNSGKIYDGACLESSIGGVCAERHALANMILAETYNAKAKIVVVADPVPKVQKNSTTPCGTCRQFIWELGTPTTSIVCMQYIQNKGSWTFPKIEKHTIKELYPNPFTPVKWG
ncbi:MAG TPA: hypothetical protein VJH04_00915 [archaeon]|uniref:CMP/dCMP-type deaminase domain-containing protein n=1 Tax=Candidatus Colwellbacteria bacterium RIFCSPLOWO2_12_FULL_44_13 TaxID=1797694 RepID=A0A1G1ZBM3_9BACT|nr:MAG: hypothetical protein A3H06_01640 [Candidatus Colwellbacteria bacterium RIFCSPLOWO2_12_FULL_44_13]HLC76744.1 hypothetical protein [archaeon]